MASLYFTRLLIFFENLIHKAILLLELALFVRFLLKILGANPEALFVTTWYRFTEPFVAPFLRAFPGVIWFDRFVLDTSTIFAMVVYLLAMHILLMLLRFFFRSEEHTSELQSHV